MSHKNNESANHSDLQVDIHPIDSMLALIHCCDDFLRHKLYEKLFSCQFALPFLILDYSDGKMLLMLWALRSIVCVWKFQQEDDILVRECRIIDCKCPIISFMRLGEESTGRYSKTYILNYILGEKHHFSHWDCEGCSNSRHFMDGIVEFSCYLPNAKDDDTFPNAVVFLNLRGNVADHSIQSAFLQKISFINVLLVCEETLDHNTLLQIQNLSSAPGGIILLFPNLEKFKQMHYSTYRKLEELQQQFIHIFYCDLKGKNITKIKHDINQFIIKRWKKIDSAFLKSLSDSVKFADDFEIKIDESTLPCSKGRVMAEEVVKQLSSDVSAKMSMLPLQGPNLWQEWAKLDKECFRQKKRSALQCFSHYHTILRQNKEAVRKKQGYYCENHTPVMESFIRNLISNDSKCQQYFLHWLKMFLDDRSREILPSIRYKYHEIREQYHKLLDQPTLKNSEQLMTLLKKLKEQSDTLLNASLGIEHLFREMGQIYEAGTLLPSVQKAVASYPYIVASLLMQGYPLELMDGEVAHIPTQWVYAILDQLVVMLKKKKLFVISILGVQSTGKSTLLNVMFGLQFTVSAGRCTRGAYFQLVPVSKSMCSQINCDYILVVDTEGLRAPELEDSQQHDNELATFVIGLADVAIINIRGEAQGDMNDILQTSVHAFIRMNLVNRQLSCHFVHQNVPDVLADINTSPGQQKFLDKLNEITRIAARLEGCEGKYQYFQKVISFNELKDITYFPCLWEGAPPMAPISKDYSNSAKILRKVLIDLIKQTKCNERSIASFKERLEVLWEAVLREKFVFDFKNTLELSAYDEADKKYSKIKYNLENEVTKWKARLAIN